MMTPEEALAIYHSGPETVVRVLLEMDTRLDASQKRVQHLEERLAKDSHKSSKPPSSDGLNKPKPKSLRTPSGRRTGGQPRHAGRTLRMVEKPDSVVSHTVNQCTRRGCSLTGQAPERVERRQVFDLPEPKLEVTAPVQYGPRVKSAAVYLKDYQLLPFERLDGSTSTTTTRLT